MQVFKLKREMHIYTNIHIYCINGKAGPHTQIHYELWQMYIIVMEANSRHF